MTAGWTDDELRRLAGDDELHIAPVRRWHGVARTSRRARIQAGGVQKDVAIEDAEEAALDQVDAAYLQKYGGRYAGIVDRINEAEHRATTLRRVPAARV